jgi:hypothetical protein
MSLSRKILCSRNVVWAIVAPFFLLSAITNGLMAVQTSNGIVAVICTGTGPLEIRIDPATGEPVEEQAPDQQSNCDWANLKFSAHLAVSPVPEVEFNLGFIDAPNVPSSVIATSRATGLPPSTGPPNVL